jgi:hypothetical protein
MRNKILFRWLKIVILLYCGIGIALYYLQDAILFLPKALPADYQYNFRSYHTENNIRYDEATNFNIIQFPAKDDTIAKGIVLYFHGNKENVNHYAQYAENFTKFNYEVWMPDYPGYGKSTGTISEKLLYEEALQVYKLARLKYKPEEIIIYGKSLGTGIAAQLACIRDCKRLILETPYTNIAAIFNQYAWMYPIKRMIHYQIPTEKYLQQVVAPISIFHGTKDATIHYSNSADLKKILKAKDEFITIEKGEHNNLPNFPLFQKKLDSLLSL